MRKLQEKERKARAENYETDQQRESRQVEEEAVAVASREEKEEEDLAKYVAMRNHELSRALAEEETERRQRKVCALSAVASLTVCTSIHLSLCLRLLLLFTCNAKLRLAILWLYSSELSLGVASCCSGYCVT